MKAKYEYKGWELWVSLNPSSIDVFKDNETRTYELPEPIIKIEQEDMYVDVYLKNGNYYSFKFEEKENSLVGDIYDEDDEHIDSFAHHCFAEENYD